MRSVGDIWDLVVEILNEEFVAHGEPLTPTLLQQIIKVSAEQLTEPDPE